ncbi:MAG: BtpA/SgcQ family protein [Deltaproteobacteria bacterium]|nr:BtpA/SgcQ family protein [Deltaproteobacteria bacterium]
MRPPPGRTPSHAHGPAARSSGAGRRSGRPHRRRPGRPAPSDRPARPRDRRRSPEPRAFCASEPTPFLPLSAVACREHTGFRSPRGALARGDLPSRRAAWYLRPVFDPRGKLIGVLHLPPLPGAPRPWPPMPVLLEAVARDARLLAEGGIDAVLVENFGDAPFEKGPVAPHTVACMTACVLAARQACGLPVGVNVLRNDAAAALGIAVAASAEFIRVNVHVGVRVTDQGLIEGAADRSLRLRAALAWTVAILADVDVKHSGPLSPRPIDDEAVETAERGLADGLIITGPSTGAPMDRAAALAVKRRVRCPVLAGSGVTTETVAATLGLVDGVIVGSDLCAGGQAGAPLERGRIEAFVRAARGAS